jgi:MFS family permease
MSEHKDIELTPSNRSLRFGFNSAKINSRILYYCVTILFFYIADSIMSYTTPSYLRDNLTSTTLMGVVFATSSIVGFVTDFLLGVLFSGKRHRFFLKWAIVLAIGFPLGYLLFPANIITFIIGLALWGIYYELLNFANSQFVVENDKFHNPEVIWSIIFFFRAISITFGPILASTLINISYSASFIVAIVCLIISATLLVFNPTQRSQENFEIKKIERLTIFKEFQIWSIFSKRIWLLLLFMFCVVLIDSAIWSIGVLLSEQLFDTNGGIPGLLLVLYGMPLFFMGFFVKKVASPFGKKRAAFITALVAAILLTLVGFTNEYYIIAILIFLFACFFAVSIPEIKGVFADLDNRVHKSRTSLIGLESSMFSIGYVIGPILSGLLADKFGIQLSFSILGMLLITVTLLCIVFVPRKIKLPQQELHRIKID